MSSQYSIRELSKEFGVTPRTLRFYEEKGLLSPDRMGQSRIYSTADRAGLILILRGKTLGLSLEQSADLIAMYDPGSNNKRQLETLIEKIQSRKQQLKSQGQEIERMINDLEQWEDRSRTAMKTTQHRKKSTRGA
ncbi:MAG: DNA-binding transcriptional MerR regulator [Candidatus Azotimanducaceae bacterium]|jgi:DNA-binding transcriptional MerR regulator